MLNIAIALLVIGGLLLLAEIFMPGFGFPGIAGILLIVASAVVMVLFVPFGIFIVGCEFFLIGAGIFLFLKLAKKNAFFGRLVLDDTLECSDTIEFEMLLGKTGVTLSPLRPVGSAEFAGAVYEVQSERFYIPAGVEVTVIDVHGPKLVVRESAGAAPRGNQN